MDKKPSFPIKFKIMGLTSIILLASLTFYTYYASNLFTNDKKAYIFETSLSTATSISNELDNIALTYLKDLEIFNQLSKINKRKAIKDFLGKSREHLIFYQYGDKLKIEINKTLAKKFKINKDELYVAIKNTLNNQKVSNETLFSSFTHNDQNYLNIASAQYGLIITSNRFKQVIESNRIYNSQIYTQLKESLFKNIYEKEVNELLKENLEQSGIVSTLEYQKERSLFAVVKSNIIPLTIVSLISYDKAFSVTDFLKKKSILFAIFILAISGIFTVLFSRSLSNPIEKLFVASKEIASGNFDINVNVGSTDEIGHLGKSFNYMTGEIRNYIEQMREKARLENEVMIAKTVQEQFFPKQEIALDQFRLSSYALPASECGGDWWGYHENEQYLITIIADATGHGLPAALLTSAINSAFISVKHLIDNGQMKAEPETILSFLNKNIVEIGSEILLTAFITVTDKKSNTLTYSNASHIDALYIPFKENLEKGDITPLIEAKGPRIGHKNESSYLSSSITVEKGDKIIFLTDGILECENSEGKQWGIRRFLKVILENNTNNNNLTSDIIDNVVAFRGKREFDDDVTIITQEVLS